jgi:3'(2'), 5'-bisphosphate nucleotidase
VTTTGSCADAVAPESESDAQLANRLAREAGELLVELRHRLRGEGMATWDVMDHGDAASHRFINDELRRHRPDDAVLDEEGKEDPRRFDADRVWIIDPLDGTREFGEPGRHDWAVHVATWRCGTAITSPPGPWRCPPSTWCSAPTRRRWFPPSTAPAHG